MRIELRPGIDLRLLTPQMSIAALIICNVYDRFGFDCVLVYGRDGMHSQQSLHYHGNALDVRTRMIDDAKVRQDLANEIARCLGPQYDVILESDHLHVEFDPKEGK